MAVFTPIDIHQAQVFCANYDAISTICDLIPIAEGTDNTNYIVKTDDQNYILTIFENRIDTNHLPAMLEFADQLHDILPTPHTYKTRTGDALGEIQDKPAALIAFLDGQSTANPAKDHCRQIGRISGRIHSAALHTVLPCNPLSLSAWQN